MDAPKGSGWFCPLYQRDIAEGQCLDINYELTDYKVEEYLNDIRKITGKDKSRILDVCKSCPNYPF